MANTLHEYIKNYDDFLLALKLQINNTSILLKKKYDDAKIINNNDELLLKYLIKERKRLIKKISLYQFIVKVDIEEFDIQINKDDYKNLLDYIKIELFEKNDLQELKKENAKYLTQYFKTINKSIWIAFYNIKIEELKNGKKIVETNDFYPFEDIEKYNIFIEYVKLHIVEPYLDYSYLYQRLLERKFIKYIKQKDFMKWLFENDFINEKTFYSFDEKNQFYTLIKSTTPQRENNFNNLFKL